MACPVEANPGAGRLGPNRQIDDRIVADEANEMAGDAVLLRLRATPGRRVRGQPVLAGVVNDERRKVRIVPVIRVQPGSQHRRDEGHHENAGHRRATVAKDATD